MISTFFLGACSADGFSSHYDSLLYEGIPLTIIKGGSGCGKSTFMRRIGQRAEACGMDVTYILCSSDPDSLDGVILPEIPMAFVDGTAPHVLEPRLCGGSMNYLNFGVFYDSIALRLVEEDVNAAQTANKAQYSGVTACLRAVRALEAGIKEAVITHSAEEELASIAECILLSALRQPGDEEQEIFRYLSALTPKGHWLCEGTPQSMCRRVYVLRDDHCLAPTLLQILRKRAAELGHRGIVCHSALQPTGEPAHLLLPSAEAAIITESADLPYRGEKFCRIDLNSTVHPDVREALGFYRTERSTLLRQAVGHMAEAKRIHDDIERLCRPYVDFAAVDALTEETLKALFD